ncbi:MAG: aspartate aminotransferase family protein, partial [Acidimicrobiaceae bacterium]|nr:aspartate aminotransferase family protein [Acidimicrobiaceae bacterium]
VLGTKAGGPIAAAGAVRHHLGEDGYLRGALSARDTTLSIAAAIKAEPRLVLRAEPDATLLSFGSATPDLDIYAVADGLAARGWYVDRQAPPPSIHLTVNAIHAETYSQFLSDLAATLDAVGNSSGALGSYGTLE